MKTILFFILSILSIDTFAQTNQTCDNLHDVYALYRDRLINDFIIGIGPNPGMCIPAENRDERPNFKRLRWGDATTHLAAYIMVLATEYLLFTKEGKNTDQTIYELYWALYAFNRLDLTAESYWGGTNNLNGFFMRDDVSTLNIPSAYLDHLNGNDISHPDIQFFSSDFNNPSAASYDNEESKDQIIQLLVAMALVKVCVPPSINYFINGIAQPFQDNLTSIHEEAKQIAHRMITYVYPLSQNTWDAGAWSIFNAADNHEVPNTRGGKMLPESYGYAEVLKYMTGEDLTANLVTVAWYISWKNWFKNTNDISLLAGRDIDKYCMLASICNPWDSPSQSANAYTAQEISNLDVPNMYVFAPLIHNLIHPGDYNNDFTKTDYEGMLNTAPYWAPHFGPYDYDNILGYGGYYWSTTSAIVHPDRFGPNNDLNGEYNGLDFLLLHNLYYLNKCCPDPLLFESKIYDTYKTPFKAAYHIRAGNDVGSPYTNGPVTVENGGDITYLAGTDISLEDGFSVDIGGTFLASVEECCNNAFPDGYVINNIPNILTPNGDGFNDWLCITAPLASYFSIIVQTVPWGVIIYTGEGIINTSPACIWDGTGAYYNGEHDVIVKVTGCSYQNDDARRILVNDLNIRPADSTYSALENDTNSVLSHPIIKIITADSITSSVKNKVFDCRPNPNQGIFTVIYNPKLSVELELFNCLSTGLKNKCNPTGHTVFNLMDMPKGVYFCRIQYTDGTFDIKKIISQ